MTKYILLVACRDLKFDDGSSANVSLISSDSGEEETIGTTEEQTGTTPIFDEILEFECKNPDSDLLKISILDGNGESRGVATFTISKIQQHDHHLGSMKLSANRGTIVVHVAEKKEEGFLTVTLRGKDLKNIEGYTQLRTSDPFYTLSRPTADGQWKPIYASNVVRNDLNPQWEEAKIEMKRLCNADFDLPLRLEVFDQEHDGKHESMGFLETSINQLLAASPNQALEMKDVDTGSEKTGEIYVESVELLDCVDSNKKAKNFMQEAVAVALTARTDANDKKEEAETIREAAAKAKEIAEAARLEAEQKAKELEEAERALAVAVTAAETAEAAIGGLE